MTILELTEKIIKKENYNTKRGQTVYSHIKRYAKALGFNDPSYCTYNDFTLSKEDRNKLIEDKIKDKSAQTIKNMKSELNKLFESAEKHGFIKLKEITKLSPAYKKSARKKIYDFNPFKRKKYALDYENWSEHAKKQYKEWEYWNTSDLADNIEERKKKYRPATIKKKLHIFQIFFGFQYNIKSIPKEQIDFHSFHNYKLIKEFIHWHIRERTNGKMNFAVHNFLATISALVNSYPPFKNEELFRKINKFKKSLSDPNPIINKEDRMATFEELMSCGYSEFPNKHLVSGKGIRMAVQAGRALAVMLLATIPLRNQNWRECIIGRHIYKKNNGEWWVRFIGDDDYASLKKSKQRNKMNEYTMPIYKEIVPYLEEYINYWRELIIRDKGIRTQEKFLFIDASGNRFTEHRYNQRVQEATLKWIGRNVNPHSFRHSIGTQMLTEGMGIEDVAMLLNDEPATVYQYYWKPLQNDVTNRFYERLDDKFKNMEKNGK